LPTFAVLGTVTVRKAVSEPPGVRVMLGGARVAEGELGPEGATEVARVNVPVKPFRLVRVRMVDESIVPLKIVRIPTDVVIE